MVDKVFYFKVWQKYSSIKENSGKLLYFYILLYYSFLKRTAIKKIILIWEFISVYYYAMNCLPTTTYNSVEKQQVINSMIFNFDIVEMRRTCFNLSDLAVM